MRNLTLECLKLLASFFVIFLHVPFPGEFGGAVACLSRFGVPMFFAISGYFSFGAKPEKLRKRRHHILWLLFLGLFIELYGRCLLAKTWGQGPLDTLRGLSLDGGDLLRFLLLQVDPIRGHLWYLAAAALCYGVLECYVRRFGTARYQPLYILGVCLTLLHLTLAEFASVLGTPVHYHWYRNGWLFGLPMFLLGLFLRQYQDQLQISYGLNGRKLLGLLAFGAVMSLAEWKSFGGFDLHVGTLVMVVALMLLAARYPRFGSRYRNLVSQFGNLASYIYLIHLTVADVVATCLPAWAGPWGKPLAVLGISLASAVVWAWMKTGISVRKNQPVS